jgi:hypothetical protein
MVLKLRRLSNLTVVKSEHKEKAVENGCNIRR